MSSTTEDDPFDLIISTYSGVNLIPRLMRLASIAKTKPYQIKSYEKIIHLIKTQTKNIELLKDAVKALTHVDPKHRLAKIDSSWVSNSRHSIQRTYDNLDSSIRGFENSSDHDKVCQLSIELGEAYKSAGDFLSAQRYYRRALEAANDNERYDEDGEAATSDDNLSCNIQAKIAEVAILEKQWTYAKNVAMRVLPYDSTGKKKTTTSYMYITDDSIVRLGIIYGVACLGSSDYEECAASLLRVGEGTGQGDDASANPTSSKIEKALEETGNIIKLKDIGLFISICALATFSRENLRFMLDKDSLYSIFIEDAPFLRTLISSFLNVKYKSFFSLWNSHSSEFKIDLYLGPHYDELYSLIRERAYNQYLTVYKSLPLDLMKSVFSENESTFINDLSSFIDKSQSNMRIDQLNGEISSVPKDEYSDIYEQSEKLANDYIHDSYSLLWAIHAMGLPEVQSEEKPSSSHGKKEKRAN